MKPASDALIMPANYGPEWSVHGREEIYLGWVQRFAREMPEGTVPQPGDLVVYRFDRCFSHGAIVVVWPLVIHDYHDTGVTYEDAARSHLGSRDYKVFSPWGRA